MNKKILLLIFSALLLFCGCRDEFDDHYHDVGDASIGKNVVQVLEEKGGFELFVQMIRRADLERTLTQSGLYTCLAPKDEHLQAWLDQHGWTVANMPERKLIEFINYHFMLGMRFYYDFEKYYETSDQWDEAPTMYTRNLMFDTRSSGKAYPSKNIRIFTNSYLENRPDDYQKMMGVAPGDFMVENVPISPTLRDIPTSNGVIHVLDGPLMLTPRMDEVMAADSELSIIMKWFDRFKGYATIGMENDKLDTTLVKYYNVSTNPVGKTMDIANEVLKSTALIPTDAAMREYFKPYLTPDQFVSFDSVPDEFVVTFLQALVFNYDYTLWGLSDIDRNQPYYYSFSGDMLALKNNIPAMFKESLVSSNSIIYKLNQVPQIPMMTNVCAGFYIYSQRYKEWSKLFKNKNVPIPGFFGVSNSYQHMPEVVLIQPDHSPAWDNGPDLDRGVDGYDAQQQDTLVQRLSCGRLLTELKDNQFEHCYYLTSYGSVLCELENGQPVFSDFTAQYPDFTAKKKVRLLSPEPVWTVESGTMYEVDGIFEALSSTDSTKLLYRKFIAKEENLARFKELVDKAGQKDRLDKLSVVGYTVFAPGNAAFSGKNISAMTEEEALTLLNKCMVSGRRIFTDGKTTGVINTLDGKTTRTLSGAWDSFMIKSQYGSARAIPAESNRQGSNGVLHVIDNLLEN